MVKSLVSTLLALFTAISTFAGPGANTQPPLTLRIAMYPYVPDGDGLFLQLEQAFERAHPGIDVQWVETYLDPETGNTQSLANDYYEGGLLKTDADVYEIDTVLLDAMIAAGKLVTTTLPSRTYYPTAAAAATVDGQTWGIPHWVCGNFLFYLQGDTAIETAASWDELLAALHDGDLLVDLKGSSTLGEWYLIALALDGGDPASLMQEVYDTTLNSDAMDRLDEALARCPLGYCRSAELHNRTGYYARMFARGEARAYVGYSESLHDALSEISESCAPTDGCVDPAQIKVRALPGASPAAQQIGWTDALGIASGLDPRTEAAARDFIDFATSWPAYQSVLEPQWPDAPRYLLPALIPAQTDAPLGPPLYAELLPAFGNRLTLRAPGLGELLPERGQEVDCALPPDRNDAAWQEHCALPETLP